MASVEYLSGFFDGEGCIRGTLQASGALSIAVSITQKNPLPLHELQGHFGVGTVGLYPQMPPYRHYTFFAYSKNAGIILAGLLPHLIVKKDEAELALQALNIERDKWGGFSEHNLQRLQFIERKLRQLKRLPISTSKEEIRQAREILSSRA